MDPGSPEAATHGARHDFGRFQAGEPYTGDIDFFVAVSRENADRLIRVFERFGFGDIDLTPSDFLEENFVVEIGREPRKIQVLTGITASASTNAIASGKAAAGRAKDLIDLTELRRL